MTTPTHSSDSSSKPGSSGATSSSRDNDASNVVEMASAQADEAAPVPPVASTAPSKTAPSKKEGSSKLTLLLGALLFLSVGLNFWQSQNQANMENRASETSIALDRAIERIDSETLRANRAETTISAIDRGVDTVNERIIELQAALADLSTLTER